ncbi:MAG: sulfotransferase [Rhodospirillales bacterium]
MLDDTDIKATLQSALQGPDPASALQRCAPYFMEDQQVPCDLWYLRGLVAEKARDYPKALASFTKANAGLGESADFLNYFGTFLLNSGQPWAALDPFKKCAALKPDAEAVQYGLAGAYLESGDYRRSFGQWEKLYKKSRSADHLHHMILSKALARDFRSAFKLLDAEGERYRLLIIALYSRQACDQAARIAARATELWPQQAGAWNYLGIIAARQNQTDEALRAYEKALALAPADHEILFNMANHLASIGRQQQAAEYYRQSLRLAPDDVRVLRNYGESVRFDADDPAIRTLEELSTRPNLPPEDRVSVLYALGKAYEDINQYNDAMRCFLKGGEVAAGLRACSVTDEIALLERVAALFDDIRIDGTTKGRSSSARPVFIVGLPRSGTTLVEQILAGHDKVHGAGELSYLRDAVLEHVDGRLGRKTLPSWEFTEPDADRIGPSLPAISRQYLDQITKLDPNALRVVDKQPMNDRYLGFAALAFPGATIIHCVRDLRDTCLSCVSKNFDAELAFADSFEAVAAYATAQRSLMAYWERKFPDRILTVSYEALVEEPEAEARRLIDAIGLDWSDRCLDFAASGRVVKTASARQVRQDVYKTSVNRWQRYLPAAAPLIRLLDNAP